MNFLAKYKWIIAAMLITWASFAVFKIFIENSDVRIISKMVTKKPLPILKYGFNIRDYKTEISKVGNDDVFGSIMAKYGFSGNTIHRMIEAADASLNLKKIIKGNEYVFLSESKTDSFIPRYFIYEKNLMEYGVFEFYGRDSFKFQLKIRPQKVVERSIAAKIEGSLFETLNKYKVHDEMAVKMADIFKWSIDFYKIQKDDEFKIIFKERYVEGKSIGIDSVLAVYFRHKGADNYAYYFPKTNAYYKPDGKELKNMFLKAPLKFDRISSRFTRQRFHPVQKVWKAHLGTDFAAPKGTPIMATADGVVQEARFKVFNGNFVKIKHNATYTTQYLHMSRIGKGMRPGVRVSQGQVIGYVGATGLASGPHVCYRFWKNGVQVDALKQNVTINRALDRKYLAEFALIIQPLQSRLEGMAMGE